MKLGIIGDIHEDIVSLRGALKIIETLNCDQIVCLGDIVGYKVNRYNYLDTRSATECIAMIRANCSEVVIGNNDLYQIKKLPLDNQIFDYPKNWYSLNYFEKKALAQDRVFLYDDVELAALMTKEDKKYLESLPEFIIKNYDGIKIMFTHFSHPDLTGEATYYPKMVEEFSGHLSFLKRNSCSLGFSGHMHFEGVSICNSEMIARNDFGKFTLENDLQWLYGPCIARGRFKNGFMTFDTKSMELESIPLNG